jgi:hypothetical protein
MRSARQTWKSVAAPSMREIIGRGAIVPAKTPSTKTNP